MIRLIGAIGALLSALQANAQQINWKQYQDIRSIHPLRVVGQMQNYGVSQNDAFKFFTPRTQGNDFQRRRAKRQQLQDAEQLIDQGRTDISRLRVASWLSLIQRGSGIYDFDNSRYQFCLPERYNLSQVSDDTGQTHVAVKINLNPLKTNRAGLSVDLGCTGSSYLTDRDDPFSVTAINDYVVSVPMPNDDIAEQLYEPLRNAYIEVACTISGLAYNTTLTRKVEGIACDIDELIVRESPSNRPLMIWYKSGDAFISELPSSSSGGNLEGTPKDDGGLSEVEREKLRVTIRSYFSPPQGLSGTALSPVTVRVEVDRAGKLSTKPQIINQGESASAAQNALGRAALRATAKASARGAFSQFDQRRFDKWKTIEISFTDREVEIH